MSEVERVIEWWVHGMEVDLSIIPDGVEHMEMWSQFWRDLRPLLTSRQGRRLALGRFMRKHYAFSFSSKSFELDQQRLFARGVFVDGAIEELPGRLWLWNPIWIEARGTLRVSARIRMTLPLASLKAAHSFDEMVEDDWMYIWGMGTLSGPESMNQDYSFVANGLRWVDQQKAMHSHGVPIAVVRDYLPKKNQNEL